MRCKNIDTLLLGLEGYSAVGHCRDTFRLGPAGIFVGWKVGHCRDTLQLGAAGILCGWAQQGYFAVGHCKDTYWLSTAGMLCGWAV